MKTLKCQTCKAPIEIDKENDTAICQYCGTKYQLDGSNSLKIKMDDNTVKMAKNVGKTALLFTLPQIFISIIVFIFIIGLFIFIGKSASKQIKNSNIEDFNYTYETYSGTTGQFTINEMLDDVITNNKKNPYMLITVVYKDFNSSNPTEIKNIKKNLDMWSRYEVSLDYNESGYVYKITIEDV